MNLYLVATVGLGDFYVVAKDPHKAYRTVRDDLDKRDYGFDEKRSLDYVKLLAEDVEYPKGKAVRLYLALPEDGK